MKGGRGIDVMVGGFVLLGLGALLFLALKAGNLGSFQTGSAYETTARFDNIGGLKVRAPVKSAGVVVGRVASIGFDAQTYQAVVVLAIQDRIKFPKDTSAKILTSGLGGDQIKMTQSAVVLENLISQFLFSKAADGDKKP
jgi:phospholipid/cholesterol/gamma-HCH transport system substrate-binding protein